MPLNLFGRKNTPEPTTDSPEPAPKAGPTMTTATVRDLLYVTYAVPPERLQAHVPAGFTLDRLPNENGDLVAFVQVVCGLYQSARWSPLPEMAGDAFYQVNYRVLVRRTVAGSGNDAKPEKRPGVWVLRTFANTTERHLSRRLLDREADYARIALFVDGDPARNVYHLYRIRSEADSGQTHLTATFDTTPLPLPIPFASETDLTAFLTQRQEQFFRLSVPGAAVGLIPSRHEALTPQRGTLTAARVTPFVDLKILTAEEALKPHSVLLQPSLTVHALPPRPVKVTAATP